MIYHYIFLTYFNFITFYGKKRAVKTALFEFYLERVGLHSHTYYANTDLFNFFTANFTAELPQIESKQKGDFNKKEERSVVHPNSTYNRI